LLLGLRRFPEAREFLNRALSLKPDFPEALNNLGVVSHAQRRFGEALSWYQRSLAIDPRNAEAHYNAGRALVALEDGDTALRHFDQALRQRPDDAGIHVSIASLLASRQEIEPAVVHYRRALELNPNLPAALVDLAWILATSDRALVRAPDEAVRLAEHATDLTGRQNATVLDTLAVAYSASGRTDLAIAAAEEALQLATGSDSRELAERIRLRLSAYRQSVNPN
jgi:tetratricopeptide (TPR) repeat protein